MTIPPCPCGQPEQWKPIPKWEGYYEVSDHGQVRGLDRAIHYRDGRRTLTPGRLMRLRSDPDGRRRVSLCRDSAYTQCRVSTLVLRAFIGEAPRDTETCHSDGDASNDHLGNLRWDTHSENVRDTVRHGRHKDAGKTHCKWGHALSGPNLASRAKGRGCRACQWAAGRQYLYGRGNVRAEADERYALIMAGLVPTRRPRSSQDGHADAGRRRSQLRPTTP